MLAAARVLVHCLVSGGTGNSAVFKSLNHAAAVNVTTRPEF